MREKIFSPNHIENDAEIMKATANVLAAAGNEVELLDEAEFIGLDKKLDTEIIVSMGRKNATLDKIADYERAGVIAVNSSRGVYNSFRETLTPILTKNKIPMPFSMVFDTDKFIPEYYDKIGCKKVWLKCENHSFHREDVTPVYNSSECETTIREFRTRGFRKCLLQEHVTGSEIKFYAIGDGSLFHWYYANGLPHRKFNEKEFKSLVMKTAELVKLDVFGGDAIICEDGSYKLIDFNDWPSFAPIRAQAAQAIAKYILNKSSEHCKINE